MRTSSIQKELRKRNKAVTAIKPIELDIRFAPQNAFIDDPARFIDAQCSRRAGKCRPGNSLIKTPTGSKPIRDLRVGDQVYGYNQDGSVSITTVTAVYDQGVQTVVDLKWNNQILASSTLNHRWLSENTFNDQRLVKELQFFNSRDKIAMEYVPIPGGSKHMKHAYTLGALLGDGCSRDRGLHISSDDTAILEYVRLELEADYVKIHRNAHTHSFNGVDKFQLEHYKEWCHGKYAHEKTCDLEEIRQWDRDSQLRFLAGLIDTDGSVAVSDGRLDIRLAMQAKDVIDAAEALFLDLFQVQCRRSLDDREKYKNGPVHQIRVSRNIDAKRILKELPTQCARKSWKDEYETLNERNTHPKRTGFVITNHRQEHCYDITVDNDTHLFLDANGLIGHNTNGVALRFFKTLEKYPKSQCIYLAMTRESAKGIMWPILRELNDKYGLGCEFMEASLTMIHPNGAKLILLGADLKGFIKRLKGRKFPGVAIDEAQDFGTHLQSLIDDVLTPSIADYADGWLALTGTPGPVPNGYFFEVTQERKHGYSHHEWTLYDNPFMPDARGFVEQLIKKRGWDENHPTLLREYRNKWVLDVQSLWIQYKESINHYQSLPNLYGKKWNYILGIDIGFKDADALALLAWHDSVPETYLVNETVTSKQGLTELVEQIQALSKQYDISKMVIDEGGLGKKLAEEMRRRHAIPVQGADKARKQETVEFLNDNLRLGKFKAKSASRFAKDSYLVQIDWDRSTPDKIIIKKKPHSDIIDAVLYAFKESPAFTYQHPKTKHKAGTVEHAKEEETRMFEEELKALQEQAAYEQYIQNLGFGKD